MSTTENNIPSTAPSSNTNPEKEPQKGDQKFHLIRPSWIRIPLKALLWIILFIALIPVLIYLPPVQSALTNVACQILEDKTGMKTSIGAFRLRFPLDVQLDDVLIIEATGDTMVAAKTAIANVKLRPLFDMDLRLNYLRLIDGKYRMVAADSSMELKLQAGLLDVDGKSSFNLNKMDLLLNRARLKDADVKMYMNVWKKKANPDTTKTKFCIRANDLKLENVSFAMSMLPTIDTLQFSTETLNLKDGLIDLTNNNIKAKYLGAEYGQLTYLTPTAKYIKEHPAPIDTISPPSAPMTIMADSISIDHFNVLYGVKGARPASGFDASYVQLSDICVSLQDFFNCQSTIRVPITRLMGRERCGLQLLSGSGLFAIDSIGLSMQNLNITTPNTHIRTTASIPFALMEMKPSAPMSIEADGYVGLADLDLFMPSMREYTSMLSPARRMLLSIDAAGTLSALRLNKISAELPHVFNLAASGYINNPLKPTHMKGDMKFRAALTSPAIAQKAINSPDINIPSFDITGHANISGQQYVAEFDMTSSAGNVAANGRINLNAESYHADITTTELNIADIMPSLGIGAITARLQANGAGFNPERAGSTTDIHLDVARADYSGHSYSDIYGLITLHGGNYELDLSSSDPDAMLSINGSGSISPDLYTIDLSTDISNLNLKALNLMEDTCNGHGNIYISGTASPSKWLYDMILSIENFEWNLAEDHKIVIPQGVAAELYADENSTSCRIDTQGVSMDFAGDSGLKTLVDKFSNVATTIQKQIEKKDLNIDELQKVLPEFALNIDTRGDGLIDQILAPSGYSMGTMTANIQNRDSLISGNLKLLTLDAGTMCLDTISLNLKQRGSLLDYKAHVGNKAGNLPEFADVKVNGYMGGNRLSAYLTQHNDKREIGYRLGFTAALVDSTITVHFTPLKATIAYMPWVFNLENHVDYNMQKRELNANLMASSAESSILLETKPAADGLNSIHLNLQNINVQDFLALSVTAPPVKASVNTDLNLRYRGTALMGEGTASIVGLEYDRTRVGDFDLNFDANLDFKGDTQAKLALMIDKSEVMQLQGLIRNNQDDQNAPSDFTLSLTQFPLSVANAFLDKSMAQLSGYVDSELKMDCKLTDPKLNGYMTFKDADVLIAMMGSKLRMGNAPISVTNNVINFNEFEIKGQNTNPLTLNGKVDASKITDINLNLMLEGNNVQLMKNNSRSHSDLSGNLFINADASVKGPLNLLDVNGNLTMLNTSDITYNISASSAAITQSQESNVVKFVNFNDTTQTVQTDSVNSSITHMRIQAGVTITPGARVTVNLPAAISGNSGGNNKVFMQPSGTLSFYQNYMGDMSLNGQLLLGEGYARYSLPVVGEKNFTFKQGSFVQWNGAVMNPILNVEAYNNMKVNVSDGGSSRLVNFQVMLDVSNNLTAPKVSFDLSAEGDLSIENELQSMTAEQRSTQAMNLLLYGQYTGPNSHTQSNFAENALYSFLTSTLNSWAANNIRGVDLSFGVNQYEQSSGSESTSATSYSYQVSKSLFNNRFKIVVGGNYTTDASADENFAENLVSDISFEYMLKQTNSMSMLVKLFRHNDYESILEGEIAETGAGFVMKRRMENLRRFFKVRWGKRKNKDNATKDSIQEEKEDSIMHQPYEF